MLQHLLEEVILQKSLTGKNQDIERKRHNLAIEKYNNDYNSWKKQMGEIELWQEEQERQKIVMHHTNLQILMMH